MSKQTEALRRALEALQSDVGGEPLPTLEIAAVEAIKDALAEKREWLGLTDEDLRNIREWQRIQEELGPVWAPMMLYLYVAIEAKLKEKNT